ncbi:MAG: ATP-dependent Clp protease proteolytic subunit [Helicobacteraceae bacterium]|jgi:ATP-dependent protease ClpP protease subunit|nr:ATP-dependent Clp protease proteolytic subunit [Helicobacteraceae bacterium]
MPSSTEILDEIKRAIDGKNNPVDIVRRKYLKKLRDLRDRNVIVYYSAWLQRTEQYADSSINDNDIYALMSCLYSIDKKQGLDLILHTPGGNVAAAEAIGSYLRKQFGDDIVVIVPQLAMSAGTMIACAAKEIIMGAHSSLGPIDPHFNGVSAHGIITEFERAKKDVSDNPLYAQVWSPILSKYPPAFVGECENAMLWAREIAYEWLISGMFKADANASDKAKKIVGELSDHNETKSHSRHIDFDKCSDMGLKITKLEGGEKRDLQDIVLSIYHAYNHTAAAFTNILKIIENHNAQTSVTFKQGA